MAAGWKGKSRKVGGELKKFENVAAAWRKNDIEILTAGWNEKNVEILAADGEDRK